MAKLRNYHALNAILRKAGPHMDKKKEQARKACRGKVQHDA